MNNKIRIAASLCIVAVVAAVAMADLQTQKGPGTYQIRDDSSNTTGFTIGSAAAGADANEIDTSDVYDAFQWNHIVLQVKSSPKVDGVVRAAATALDSGAVTVYTQGSNYSNAYFKDIDTTTAADSLVVSEETWFQARLYRYLRWRIVPGTKLDDSGMTVNLTINATKR